MKNSEGKLYGIGVGPGSEEFLTIKAVNILKDCDIVISPSAKDGGESIALNACRKYINDKAQIIVRHFPMGGKDRDKKLVESVEFVENLLKENKKVVFLTIGDPFVYSTYTYLLEYIKKDKYKTETVPGITSFCASASLIEEPLVIGDEPLLILPATKIKCIKDEKFVVVMKLYKREKEVLDFLEEKGFKYTCIRRAYRQGQEILKSRQEIINNTDYMTLLIAHRD